LQVAAATAKGAFNLLVVDCNCKAWNALHSLHCVALFVCGVWTDGVKCSGPPASLQLILQADMYCC